MPTNTSKHPLSVHEYENDDQRHISCFERKRHVSYVMNGIREKYHHADEKHDDTLEELILAEDDYVLALQYLADENWEKLSELAERGGCWDPSVDPEYFDAQDEEKA